MSFGDDGSRPPVAAIQAAIDFAVQRKVVLVAAAADESVKEQGAALEPSAAVRDRART